MQEPGRRNMLARIHIAKKELNLSDEHYRAVLGTAGLSSAAEIRHPAEFHKIMDEFQKLGYQPSTQRPHFSQKVSEKQQKKIRALWVKNSRQKAMPSLEKFIYHMFKKSAKQLSGTDATKLIIAIERL